MDKRLHLEEEAARCLFCADAPCSRACVKGDPARAIRAILGCGRCYTSSMDGGHQAINFDADTRLPRIVGTKCVGCHLCRLVCPTGAVGTTKRIAKKQK